MTQHGERCAWRGGLIRAKASSQEWRKADDLKSENNRRANTVGFALTMLQRRLASSPEAIYQSLRRRRERLEKKLREVELMHRAAILAGPTPDVPELDDDDIDDAPKKKKKKAFDEDE